MVPNATQRRTRSMSHNHGDVGLQLDEDNALVASDDEDENRSEEQGQVGRRSRIG